MSGKPGSLRAPLALHMRVGRLVVDSAALSGQAGARGLREALPDRIAGRLDRTAPSAAQPNARPDVVDAIADAVAASLSPHLSGTRRG